MNSVFWQAYIPTQFHENMSLFHECAISYEFEQRDLY